jgi:hypothetical protein
MLVVLIIQKDSLIKHIIWERSDYRPVVMRTGMVQLVTLLVFHNYLHLIL